MWYKLAAFILKNRLTLLILIVSVTVFMAYQASKVQLSYEFTRAIPLDNPKYQDYQNFKIKNH
jgi:predicted RND superfamily exporter protein